MHNEELFVGSYKHSNWFSDINVCFKPRNRKAIHCWIWITDHLFLRDISNCPWTILIKDTHRTTLLISFKVKSLNYLWNARSAAQLGDQCVWSSSCFWDGLLSESVCFFLLCVKGDVISWQRFIGGPILHSTFKLFVNFTVDFCEVFLRTELVLYPKVWNRFVRLKYFVNIRELLKWHIS